MPKIGRNALLLASLCALAGEASMAQTRKPAAPPATRHSMVGGERMVFALILSRHGVRSPTWSNERLDQYSALPWPQWEVPPGNLTPHGYQLLKLFGAYDREYFSQAGFLEREGCSEAPQVFFWADADQRAMASGAALAEGLMPGCDLAVHSLPSGQEDPLFHPLAAGVGSISRAQALAAVKARSDGTSALSVRANLPALEEVQRILDGCGSGAPCKPDAPQPSTRLLQIPASSGGDSDHGISLNGPLAAGSTIAEDLLLEYADGLAAPAVGWGNVGSSQIREMMSLHTAYFDLLYRTPYLARADASNLLDHISRTLAQAASGKAVAGALGAPDQKLVVLVGHDTNLAAIASLLDLRWTVDGRENDTPPGAELVFELWCDRAGKFTVRTSYVSQTLEQMRKATILSMERPPARREVALAGCENANHACRWEEFERIATAAINPAFVVSSPQ